MTKEISVTLRDLSKLSKSTDSESNSPTLYTYNEEQKFYNKHPFPSQLRMVIIENSGSGKTKLLFKVLLKGYLDIQ